MSIIKRKAGSEDIVKSVLEFDAVPTEGSPNLVESGVVAQAIGNLGQPLQWKGPATVAQLNAGITGIQPGWTYTLTDAGTLTDGSVKVDVGDEVAWTEDGEWFKLGGDGGIKYVSIGDSYSDIQAIIDRGQFPIMKVTAGQGYLYYYPSFEYNQFVFKCVADSGIYGLRWNGTVWAAQDTKVPLAEAIAPEYDPTATYPTVGTAVMHKGLRYVSNTAINTAEDWTPVHWTQKSVEDEIGNVETLLAAL